MLASSQFTKNPVLQNLTNNFAATFLNWDGDENKCKVCNKIIDMNQFKNLDSIYIKEYKISGMCVSCQIRLFN